MSCYTQSPSASTGLGLWDLLAHIVELVAVPVLNNSVQFEMQSPSASTGLGFWDLLAHIVEQPVPVPPSGAAMSPQLADFLTQALTKVRNNLHTGEQRNLETEFTLGRSTSRIFAVSGCPWHALKFVRSDLWLCHLDFRDNRASLLQDPAQRPSAAELLQHPFLQPAADGSPPADLAQLVARAAATRSCTASQVLPVTVAAVAVLMGVVTQSFSKPTLLLLPTSLTTPNSCCLSWMTTSREHGLPPETHMCMQLQEGPLGAAAESLSVSAAQVLPPPGSGGW